MPLPDINPWEHDPTPAPESGWRFRCETCGQFCNPNWQDYGPVLCEGREHHFGFRSDCCGAGYFEAPA
jgi:hypothetical protein